MTNKLMVSDHWQKMVKNMSISRIGQKKGSKNLFKENGLKND